VVDVADLDELEAEPAAERVVVGGAAAAHGGRGLEREHRVDGRARAHQRLQGGDALDVEPDPGEPHAAHRRYVRATSSTASITSAASASSRRGSTGRLRMRWNAS